MSRCPEIIPCLCVCVCSVSNGDSQVLQLRVHLHLRHRGDSQIRSVRHTQVLQRQVRVKTQ